MARKRIRDAAGLARVVKGWGEARPTPRRPQRAQAGAQAATNRRVYTEMSKYLNKLPTDIEALDCIWLEDNTQQGLEAGQYKVNFQDFFTPALEVLAYAAYGGLYRSDVAPQGPLAIGAGWTTVEFDASTVATPRGMTVDVANNTFAITLAGVYSLNFSIGLEHDESQQGREFNWRVWDTVDADQLFVRTIGTGRNQAVTTYAKHIQFELAEADVGHPLRIDVGGGSDYVIVEWQDAEISVSGVGEYRGTLGA